MAIFNGTLVVQAINFGIFYWFVTTFFLKKGFAVIAEKASLHQELLTTRERYTQMIKSLKEQKLALLQAARERFAQQIPSDSDESLVKGAHVYEAPVITSVTYDQKSIDEAARYVAKKVLHD